MTNPASGYVAAVRRALGDLPEKLRAEAISDLEELIAEVDSAEVDSAEVPPGTQAASPAPATDSSVRSAEALMAALGSPESYAAGVRAALATQMDADADVAAQARALGLPVEFRGPTNRQVRARVWDPTNPSLLVPRLFGAGWTVNLGAVATRLGLLRPDDTDEDVLAAIPPKTLLAARLVPAGLAMGVVTALATRWRDLPAQVPVSWSASGRPTRWGDKRQLLLIGLVAAAPAAWAQIPGPEPTDALVRAATASWAATIAGAMTATTLWDADASPGDPGHGALLPASLLPAWGLALAVLLIPIRTGLRSIWREQGLRGGRR